MQKLILEKPAIISIDLAERPLSDVIMEVEALYFSHVLTEARGNKTHAAKRTGMTLDTFRRKVNGYKVRAVFHLE